ncbi:TPA: hypothetical protein ACPYU1_000835 [Raoultella planticola]
MGNKKSARIIAEVTKKAPPLGNKAYARELRKLHVELVKLQQWVVSKGLKVCIVFEVRLNIISHILSQIPYKRLPGEAVTLPKRKIGKVKTTHYPFRYIAERY